MLVLTPTELAALQSTGLPLVLLLEMDLDEPLYCNHTAMEVTIAGTTYIGTAGVGSVGAVQDSPAEIKPLQFTLSGVPSTQVALALGTQVQGKPVRMKLAMLDPATGQVLRVFPVWAGRCDVMALEDGVDKATITVTAEHAGIDLVRPSGSTYSHHEQQRLHPGDMAFQYMSDQVDVQVTWPAATWGRR